MGIYEQVNEQLKDAMRARDTARVAALRNVRAGFIEDMKTDNSTVLADDRCVAVLRRQAKQRLESIEAFRAGGREDLVASEVAELAVLEGFLPKRADDATTRGWVETAIAASGATSVKDVGKVVGLVMKDHKDDVDGKRVQEIVRELLT
ncbi:MAG: GatB/YqeY domain-containing protein [Deltaproteobacteria bacterium]|nr:GatB/YqeY domain-containing protein [Deltaproteobacteria bacterium]